MSRHGAGFSLAPISVAARARLAAIRVNGTFATGAALFGTIVVECVLVPLFVSTSTTVFVGVPPTGPSLTHPFGTDAFGHDVFIRTLIGRRLALWPALMARFSPDVYASHSHIHVDSPGARIELVPSAVRPYCPNALSFVT